MRQNKGNEELDSVIKKLHKNRNYRADVKPLTVEELEVIKGNLNVADIDCDTNSKETVVFEILKDVEIL